MFVLIVLQLIAVILTAHDEIYTGTDSSAVKFCKKKVFSRLPHATECNKYYQCHFSNTYLKSCPSGQLFNHVRVCFNSKYVDCKGRHIPAEHNESSILISQQPDATEVIYDVVMICKKKITGRVHDSQDCRKFYACVAGVVYPRQCPTGQLFDINKFECGSPGSVQCLGKIVEETNISTVTSKPTQTLTTKGLTTTPVWIIGNPDYSDKYKNVFRPAILFSGSRYFLSLEFYQSDVKSQATCRSFNSDLAVVDGPEEEHFIQTLINKKDVFCIMIAGTDKDEEGKWVVQATGQPLPYTCWSEMHREPNGGTEQNCIAYDFDFECFLDIYCERIGRYFQCQYLCEQKIV